MKDLPLHRLSERPLSHVQRPRIKLWELLTQHWECEATVSKDDVYGLLGMSGDSEALRIQPDYSEWVSVADVYVDLVAKLVHATGSTDLVCACRGGRNTQSLPAWVSDHWSTDAVISGICLHERYGGTSRRQRGFRRRRSIRHRRKASSDLADGWRATLTEMQ